MTIHTDDVYGDYIVDSTQYENAVWLTSVDTADGLKIVNQHYYAQVDSKALECDPLTSGIGWTLDGNYLTTQLGGETFYLRYTGEHYSVTDKKEYAGSVAMFEKTTATDVISGSGQTQTKIIYRRADTFEAGKEYIIFGSYRIPYSSSGGASIDEFPTDPVEHSGLRGELSDGTVVTVYPVSEQFYLIIYGEVSWLKEMYDVEMLILNNSSTDTIENCVAELILPEGLSLAAMTEGEQSAVQTVDYIPENGSHSLHWYVRGDEPGTYNITATLSGTMMPFNEEFYYEYEADSPIKVYAGNAMHMTFYIPDTAYKGVDYVVRIELENVSDKVLYGVTHAITGWEQGKITHYSDGRSVPEPYGSGGFVGSCYAGEFYPGDKIVIEVGFDILFESTLIKNLMENIDQTEELYEYYEAVKTAFDMISTVTDFCENAGKALDGVVESENFTDLERLKASKELADAIKELYEKFQKGDARSVKLANLVESSELYEILQACADGEASGAFVSAETAEKLLEYAEQIRMVISESEESEEVPFNAFDSLRTMVSNLPIKFVVDSVTLEVMEDSTTTIPYTIKMVSQNAPYMGVENWGRYLYNLVVASMGKIESPWYAQAFGVPEDLTGYEDAVDYVQQTENESAAYSVHKDHTTTFRAWIERNADAQAAAGIALNAVSTTETGFLLETDNETAVYEDGVMTFTGNAILEVTALSNEDGTLYIEDDEGNVWTVVIDVVEEHDCHSDTWVVELAPTEEQDGYRAKFCDVCGDTIAIEVLTSCGAHEYGSWTVTKDATEDSMGIRYRECKHCYARETEFLPIVVAQSFTDVAPGTFYYEPVMWAVSNGIVYGTTDTTFGPNDQCMRAHVITFLWRAAGEPEPKTNVNPFTDVKKSDYFYKAVLWGVENDIVAGISANKFGPTNQCTRAQVITFMWRAAGRPDSDAKISFTDVRPGTYYTTAVAWAVEKGITYGISSTKFGVDNICNRAQVVSFLYRAAAE